MNYQELSFRAVKLIELEDLESYLTRRTGMEPNPNAGILQSSVCQSAGHKKKNKRHRKKYSRS